MATSDDPLDTRVTLFQQMLNPRNREASWRTFVNRYQPMILSWCRKRGLNESDADDVSQSVLERLWKKLPDFHYDPQKKFRAWLHTVVENLIRNWRRDLGRRPGVCGSGDSDAASRLAQVPDANLDELVASLDSNLQQDLTRSDAVVAEVRRRVADHTWQAYWQTEHVRRDAKEVAQSLGMKLAAVYVAKKRVADMLRKVGQEMFGDDAARR